MGERGLNAYARPAPVGVPLLLFVCGRSFLLLVGRGQSLLPLMPNFFRRFSGHAGEFFEAISSFCIDLALDFPKFGQDGVGVGHIIT